MIKFTLFNKSGIRNDIKDMLIDDCETVKEYSIVMDLNNADLILCRKEDIPDNTFYIGTVYPESYGHNRDDVIENIDTHRFQDDGYINKFYKDINDVVWDFKRNPCNFLTKTEVVNKYGSKYLIDVAFYEKFHPKSRQYKGKWFTPTAYLYIKPVIEYYKNKGIEHIDDKKESEFKVNIKDLIYIKGANIDFTKKDK